MVDTYHLWWDDRAPAADRPGGRGRPDRTPSSWPTGSPRCPEGVLLGRGQIGDGCVDLRGWRERVDAAGYRGACEVEIFNPALWARDGAEVLAESPTGSADCVL